MRFGIIVFPGTSSDGDCHHVLKNVLGQEVDVLYSWESKISSKYDCLILPGGSSYGNYFRPGAIARFTPIMEEVIKFANEGGLVLGINNGFQILTEAGLLPGAFMPNKGLKFICKNVFLKVENNNTPFTGNFTQDHVIQLPVAHSHGAYICDQTTLEDLEANNKIVFRYCTNTGEVSALANFDGTSNNIAGITNGEGNVLGMMPFPERSSERILGNEDGKEVFTSIINWLKRGRK
ncbi:MAG: phosphoribosylformylglycinamidine synthase subunit PurQ [Peptococcales bacterium]|jgi:phosphoribosylformylglycinamidine synthase I